MKPVAPVIPGHDLPVTNFAESQDEYQTLPAYRESDGTVLTRWHLSWRERLCVLFFGDVYLWLMTFNRPLQPVMLQVEAPKIEAQPEAKAQIGEVDVVFDLDILNYSGKWKQAQQSAREVLMITTDSPDYWPSARELFLALGGQYLDGHSS